MNRVQMVVTVTAVTLAAIVAGCSKQDAKRVTAPRLPIPTARGARWLTDQEVEGAAALAAKSPLMTRAVSEQATDPNLYYLARGALGAVGTASDGRPVRFTVLPYQDLNDQDRAVYFAYLELGDQKRVETFELIRNRRPEGADVDFHPIQPGLWLRSGPVYAETPSGPVKMSSERWRWERFAPCFIMMAEMNLSQADQSCHEMGDLPHCRLITTAIAVAMAAIYCAIAAFS